MDALNTCSDCHTSDATLVAIEQQFSLSPHGFGNFEVRGPGYAGGSCVACHTSQGFVANVTGETADYTGGVASMNCRTCHQVHMTFEGQDFALTTTDPVTLMVTGNAVDAGAAANVCVNCHQARPEDAYPQWDADVATTFNIPSTHFYFHYGTQSNIFYQEFPAELSFGLADVGAFRFHADAGCNGCHMGTGDAVAAFDLPTSTPGGELGHNWAPAPTMCNQCHNDPLEEGFDYGSVRTDVSTSLLELAQCLEAEGVITIDNADPTHLHFSPVVGDHPEPFVAAFMAAQAMTDDGSWGAHNPNVVPAWLDNVRTEMDANSANTACDYPLVLP